MKSKKILFYALLMSNYWFMQCMEKENHNDQLILAIIHQDLEKMDAELKAKSPNYLDGKFSPLEFACTIGNAAVIEKLLAAGAAIDYQEFDKDYWPCNMTPLTQAALHGHFEICEKLIARGAKINPLNPNNFTPLHAAARKGYTDIVSLLIKHKADLDALTEYEHNTPLHEAIPEKDAPHKNEGNPKINKFETCRLLLDAGAAPNVRNNYYPDKQSPFSVPDKTALFFAAERNNLLFVTLLLCYGANSGIQDRNNKYPLDLPAIAPYFD